MAAYHKAFWQIKDKSKKLKCRLLQFLFGALRVNNRQVFIVAQYRCSRFSSETNCLLRDSFLLIFFLFHLLND